MGVEARWLHDEGVTLYGSVLRIVRAMGTHYVCLFGW